MKPVVLTFAVLMTGLLDGPSLGAFEDPRPRRWIISPDQEYLIVLEGKNPNQADAFTIQDSHGDLYFSSRKCKDLRAVASYEPRDFCWSPDSHFLAFAGGRPGLVRSYVLYDNLGTVSTPERSVFTVIMLPPLAKGAAAPWIEPTKWLDNKTLEVAVSGPHTRAASGKPYRGTARLKAIPSEHPLEPPIGYEVLAESVEAKSAGSPMAPGL